MRVLKCLTITLLGVARVTAQDDPNQPTTPAPTTPTTTTPPLTPTLGAIMPVADNLPGFCPPNLSVDTNPDHGGGDCRCGSSVGLSLGANVQPLAAVPDWSNGQNCGCTFQANECGCYDDEGGNGWLYGSVDVANNTDNLGGLGGGKGEKCTVTVSVPVPGPTVPVPVPGPGCQPGDRYCTVTVTETSPGQPQPTLPPKTVTQTIPGQPQPPETVTVPVPSPPTVTVPKTSTTEITTKPTSTVVGSTTRSTSTVTGSTTRSTSTVVGSTTRPTSTVITTRPTSTVTGSSTRSTTRSSTTFVTVNAAPVQTGAMAIGAMFGGAVVLANL